MKKYFLYVPIGVAIIVNIIIGFLASTPFMIAVVCLHGLFSTPTISEQIIGVLIIIGIVIVTIFINFIVYLICVKSKEKEIPNMEKKNIIFPVIMILGLFIFFALSFFILPDFWLMCNSWW